ncbi:MAG: hypothetical protein M3O82_03275, partial [Verrucomicrobiota bacterium]|nr:hypothetical protein [Verrucomicrobiota bacterium]
RCTVADFFRDREISVRSFQAAFLNADAERGCGHGKSAKRVVALAQLKLLARYADLDAARLGLHNEKKLIE